ncbi:MAG: hypothetical protein QOC89_3583 [Paraburkholderia sp.]|nr:hypothetical protein [Paraburkholderia sp.]
MDQAAGRAQHDGVCQISADVASMLEEILAIHDQQLTVAATRHIVEAKARFARFIKSDLRSPIPNDAQTAERRDETELNGSATANSLQ